MIRRLSLGQRVVVVPLDPFSAFCGRQGTVTGFAVSGNYSSVLVLLDGSDESLHFQAYELEELFR